MMTKEEYLQRMQEEKEDFVPGWDAIDEACKKVYGDQKPAHYATAIQNRVIFGGNQYLDGYSIYVSPKGYRHIVTYGMSELYASPEAYGEDFSKWGYEMTMKIKADNDEDVMWAINLLNNMAHYVNDSENYFEEGDSIPSGGNPIKPGSGSLLSGGLLCVLDTEMPGVDTVHGRLDFIQLIGLTQKEFACIKENQDKVSELVDKMKADSPDLVIDLERTKEYV